MAKKVLTPEIINNGDSALGASDALPKKNKPKNELDVDEKLRRVFEEYPTVDRLYCDENNELFFDRTKSGMTVVQRSEILSLNKK
jgi:hypothetical protein